MAMNTSDFILGTVQFGLDYGVSNISGKTEESEVKDILKYAALSGIKCLDTAPAYGCSESILSTTIGGEFSVYTKLLPIVGDDIEPVIRALEKSIDLFGKKLKGVSVHDVNNLSIKGYSKLLSKLRDFKCRGLIEEIGVSIYEPDEISKFLDYLEPDVIQLPFNIFDQRFKHDLDLKELIKIGCKVHIRSVFLQGLLLMRPCDIPKKISQYINGVDRLSVYAKARDVSVYELCLILVMQQEWVDKVVVGVNGGGQLRALLDSIKKIKFENRECLDLSEFSNANPLLINPANW